MAKNDDIKKNLAMLKKACTSASSVNITTMKYKNLRSYESMLVGRLLESMNTLICCSSSVTSAADEFVKVRNTIISSC